MQPISILLVEDNPGDVVLLRAALGKTNVEARLVVAGNGEQALDVLHRRAGHAGDPPIDLALFDVNLPGMTGIELLETVRSDPAFGQLPVVMLSSSDAAADIRRSYEARASRYLTKPLQVADLLQVMRDLEDLRCSSGPTRGSG